MIDVELDIKRNIISRNNFMVLINPTAEDIASLSQLTCEIFIHSFFTEEIEHNKIFSMFDSIKIPKKRSFVEPVVVNGISDCELAEIIKKTVKIHID